MTTTWMNLCLGVVLALGTTTVTGAMRFAFGGAAVLIFALFVARVVRLYRE